jgi:hypothetical protein
MKRSGRPGIAALLAAMHMHAAGQNYRVILQGKSIVLEE